MEPERIRLKPIINNGVNLKTIDYRQATIDDKPQLLALEQAVIEAERPFNTTIKIRDAHYYDLETLINADNSHLILAESNGQITGTGYALIRGSKKSLEHEYHAYLGFK